MTCFSTLNSRTEIRTTHISRLCQMWVVYDLMKCLLDIPLAWGAYYLLFSLCCIRTNHSLVWHTRGYCSSIEHMASDIGHDMYVVHTLDLMCSDTVDNLKICGTLRRTTDKISGIARADNECSRVVWLQCQFCITSRALCGDICGACKSCKCWDHSKPFIRAYLWPQDCHS